MSQIFKYGDFEAELNLLDLDVYENLEEANDKMQKGIKAKRIK